MPDRPTAAELVRAVKEHLEREVMGELKNAKLRYQTLVAAHVLSVVEREMELGEALLRAELASLCDLEGGAMPEGLSLREIDEEVTRRTRALCTSIRTRGLADRAKVLEHVRRSVKAKLAVANPAYTSLPPRRPTPNE